MATKATTGKTELEIMGVKVTVDTDATEKMANDFWFLDDFTSEEPQAQFRAFTRLLKAALGDAYRDVLKELQGDDERLAVEKVSDFANEVFKANESAKNSSSRQQFSGTTARK